MGSVILSVFEVVLVGFTVWGLFNESKFVRFEEKLFSFIKAKYRRGRLKIISGKNTADKTCA